MTNSEPSIPAVWQNAKSKKKRKASRSAGEHEQVKLSLTLDRTRYSINLGFDWKASSTI